MMYRRECLPDDHPECLYNHIKSAGFVPEEFGIYVQGQRELEEETRGWSRQQLVNEIYALRQQLEGLAKAGFL